jgi:hypothetical protein
MDMKKLIAKRSKLEEQLDKVNAEIDALENLTPAQQLAEYLHGKQCNWDHTSGCGWFYESWEKPGYDRNQYLEKAERLISKGMGPDDVQKMVEKYPELFD